MKSTKIRPMNQKGLYYWPIIGLIEVLGQFLIELMILYKIHEVLI